MAYFGNFLLPKICLTSEAVWNIVESMNDKKLQTFDQPEVLIALKIVEKVIYKDQNMINALYKDKKFIKALGK